MTFTFVCQACDDSFDVEYAQLAEEAKGLKCPNCGKKLSASETEDFVSAVDEVLSQTAAIRKRFAVTFEVDTEDLPPPFDGGVKRSAGGDDEDEEEEGDETEDADSSLNELSEDEDDEQF